MGLGCPREETVHKSSTALALLAMLIVQFPSRRVGCGAAAVGSAVVNKG
jgi:hypothetical protein